MTLRVNQLTGFGAGVGGAADQSFFGLIQGLGLDANLQLCLDAGDALSYDTAVDAQKWFDRTSNNTDFYRGADGTLDTDDPTFNGTIDGLSVNEYFSFDGGDFFDLIAGTNPSWVENFHKNNATFTLAVWSRGDPGGSQDIFSNAATNTNIGFGWWHVVGSNLPRISIRDGSGSSALSVFATDGITAAEHFDALSIDEAAGGGGSFFYLDGAYNQVSSSDTFDATYGTPSSSSATALLRIGAGVDDTAFLPSGARIYGLCAWDVSLSKADLDAIWDATKFRIGL